MGEKIASLFVEIGGDSSKLDKTLKDTKANLFGVKAEAQKMGGGLVDNFKRVAAAAGGIMLAGKAVDELGKFIKSSIEDTASYAREIMNLSTALGVSAEEASYLYQIADDLKIPANNMETAFKQAMKNGVQPSIANLKELSGQYRALKDPVDRAQFAMKIFGTRAGPEMQKLLEQTPEAIDAMAKSAQEAGLILTGEALRAAREYEQALDDLGDTAEGLKIKIGTGLIPSVTRFLELVNDPNADRAANLINEIFKGTFLETGESKILRAALDATAGMQIEADMAERLRGELDNVKSSTDALAEAERLADEKADFLKDSMRELTKELLFNEAAAGLDADAAFLLAKNMGLVDKETEAALTYLDDLKDKYDVNRDGAIDAGEAAAGYTMEVGFLGEAIQALKDKHITITVDNITNYIETRGKPLTSERTKYGGEQEGYATGGEFIIPSGYTESYPLAPGRVASAGEKVTVTPVGQTDKDTKPYVIVYATLENGVSVDRLAYEVTRRVQDKIAGK